MAFGQRKFKIRVQRRDASKSKPQRISLVSQRRIVVNGKTVTAGAKADLTKPSQLRNIVAKPKVKPPTGKLKGAPGKKSKNLKAVKKWNKIKGR